MEAELFASKRKPSLASAQTKLFGNEGSKKDSPTVENDVKPEGTGNSVHSVLAKIICSLFTAHYQL